MEKPWQSALTSASPQPGSHHAAVAIRNASKFSGLTLCSAADPLQSDETSGCLEEKLFDISGTWTEIFRGCLAPARRPRVGVLLVDLGELHE